MSFHFNPEKRSSISNTHQCPFSLVQQLHQPLQQKDHNESKSSSLTLFLQVKTWCTAAYCVMVSMQVWDEDRGDLGQSVIDVVPVVSAELTKGSLSTVQQQRLTRASCEYKQTNKHVKHAQTNTKLQTVDEYSLLSTHASLFITGRLCRFYKFTLRNHFNQFLSLLKLTRDSEALFKHYWGYMGNTSGVYNDENTCQDAAADSCSWMRYCLKLIF